MKLSLEARAVYERKQENKRYKKSLLHTAKIEGEERGKKIGRKEEKIEIAKNLLLANMDIEFICKTTSLSVEEIEELRDL